MRDRRLDTALVTIGIGLILGVAATGPAPAASKPKTLLKVATLAPEGSTWMTIMDELDAEVRDATGNQVGFKFYPNMVQGDEQVVLRRIRNGQLQGGGFTGAGLGEIAPAIRVMELPFLIKSDDEVDAVHAAIDSDLIRLLEEKGFVLLGWAEVGPIYLFTSTPVRSRADMSKVKMWLWEGDPVAEAFFRAFEIPPIPLSIAHVMTSLQTGMVDGVYSSPYGCIALQWFTRTRYMTDIPVTHATGALVVSTAAWTKIPAEYRETVRTIARKHLDRLVRETRRENADALLELTRHGIELVHPDPSDIASFQDQARMVWHELAGKLYPAGMLDRVLATLDRHRTSAIADRDE